MRVPCYVWLPCVLSVPLGLVSSVSPCLWCLETWVLVRYWALYPTTNTFFSSLQCWGELSQVESVRFPSVTLLFLLSTLCLLKQITCIRCVSLLGGWQSTEFIWTASVGQVWRFSMCYFIRSFVYMSINTHFLVWWKNSLILSLPRIYHRKFYFTYVFILHFELESLLHWFCCRIITTSNFRSFFSWPLSSLKSYHQSVSLSLCVCVWVSLCLSQIPCLCLSVCPSVLPFFPLFSPLSPMSLHSGITMSQNASWDSSHHTWRFSQCFREI